MNAFLLHGADAAAIGHLLIHAPAPEAGWRRSAPRTMDMSPLSLKVEDLAGRRVFAVHEPGALVDVALPAGRYRVTVRDGEVERCYGATVEPHGAIDLHVRRHG